MNKDEVLQKLYEIVRWDYEEGADKKYSCPFPTNVRKHVKKLLSEAEVYIESDCPKCDICETLTVEMNSHYVCPNCGHHQ